MRKIHEAAQELVDLIGSTIEPLDEIANAMNFFARSFEYLRTSEQQFRSCAEALCKRLIEVGSRGEPLAANTITNLCANSGTRFQLLVEIATDVFWRELQLIDDNRYDFIANVLVGSRARVSARPRTIVMRSHSPRYVDLMRQLKTGCLRFLERLSTDDAKAASLVMLLNSETLTPLYRRHGALLFGNLWKTDMFIRASALPIFLRALGAQGGLFPPEAGLDHTKSKNRR
jgi:hypothetical protein